MKVKEIAAERAERVAMYAGAIEAVELLETLPEDLPNVDGYDRDVAASDILTAVKYEDDASDLEPLPSELEPYAAKLRTIRDKVRKATAGDRWGEVVSEDFFDLCGTWSVAELDEIFKLRDASLAVYDHAAAERALLDGLRKRYGSERYYEDEVESFIQEAVAEDNQTLAKLRRLRELDSAKWDVLIEVFERRAALRKRNGQLWEDNDQRVLLDELVMGE